MRLHSFALFAALLLLALGMSVAAAPVDTSGMRLLTHDDGKMDERVKLNLSGSTVEFKTDGPCDLTGLQFFGARYATDATPLDNFVVTVSDESFRAMQRIDKPLTNISPGRDTWQTITLEPALSVSGKFYITLIHDSTPRKGVYLGVDATAPGESSKVGVPGTVATTVDPKVNFMIRAVTAPPGTAAAARAAKPTPAAKKPVAANVSATPAKPAAKPALTPFSRPAAGGQMAYRDANRRVFMRSKAPSLPRGLGRVDVSWDVAPPVSITLQYAGYGAKKPPVSIGQFNTKRFVVDFPVPEPAQFNVLVEKPGFQPASKVFRVVRGSTQQWRAVLTRGGAAAPAPSPGPAVAEPANASPNLPANPLPPSADPDLNSTGFGGNMSNPDQPAIQPDNAPVAPSINAPSPLPNVNDPAVRSNAAPRVRRNVPADGERIAPRNRDNAQPGAPAEEGYRRPRNRPGNATPPAPGANGAGADEMPPPPAL